MGNSKQARFNRIGSSGHNPNNYIHVDMINAPATTIGRTFRTTYMRSRGVNPSIQNNQRFVFKTVTRELRQQLYETGGKTSEAMKPPVPPPQSYEDWVAFKIAYPPMAALTVANDLSINDLWFWDSSAGTFDFSYEGVKATPNKRVFTIVEGTPYHMQASTESNQSRDFCGNDLDSSFIVADQPLAFKLMFDPASFSDANKYHFVASTEPKNFDISSVLHFSDGTTSNLHFDISSTLGETANQTVDISLGSTILNNAASLEKLQKGNFKIETQILQYNKNTKTYDVNAATKNKNVVEFKNNISTGFHVYTPPYLVTDFSLLDITTSNTVNKALLTNHVGNQSRDPSKPQMPNTRYPHLAGKIFLDNAYLRNNITMTLNHGFPSDVSNDWIDAIEYNQSADRSGGWTDVSNLEIINDNSYNKVRFDIFGSDSSEASKVSSNDKYFWLRTSLKIPPTCKANPSSKSKISFTMDMSANCILMNNFRVINASFQYKDSTGSKYVNIFSRV